MYVDSYLIPDSSPQTSQKPSVGSYDCNPSIWGARPRGQENRVRGQLELYFQASLGYRMRTCLKKTMSGNWV